MDDKWKSRKFFQQQESLGLASLAYFLQKPLGLPTITGLEFLVFLAAFGGMYFLVNLYERRMGGNGQKPEPPAPGAVQ